MRNPDFLMQWILLGSGRWEAAAGDGEGRTKTMDEVFIFSDGKLRAGTLLSPIDPAFRPRTQFTQCSNSDHSALAIFQKYFHTPTSLDHTGAWESDPTFTLAISVRLFLDEMNQWTE